MNSRHFSILYFRNKEKFADAKGAIRNRKSKDRQHNGQKNNLKGQTMIYKTLHSQLKIEQNEPCK